MSGDTSAPVRTWRGLSPGAQTLTIVPISQFQPPTGGGNEGASYPVSVTVAYASADGEAARVTLAEGSPVVALTASRDRLVATYDHDVSSHEWCTGYRWDIVLSGTNRTVFDDE